MGRPSWSDPNRALPPRGPSDRAIAVRYLREVLERPTLVDETQSGDSMLAALEQSGEVAKIDEVYHFLEEAVAGSVDNYQTVLAALETLYEDKLFPLDPHAQVNDADDD